MASQPDTGRAGHVLTCPALLLVPLVCRAWPAQIGRTIFTGNSANACRFRPVSIQSPRRDLSVKSTESVTMATLKFPARRLIIAGGFAVAVAAAPAIAVVATPLPTATPLAQCPAGEEHDLYTSLCVPHLVPNAGQPYRRSPATPTSPRGDHPGWRRRHSVHRPQLRSVHRPGRRGCGRRTGSGASVDRGQQPDGNRLRGQHRVVAGARAGGAAVAYMVVSWLQNLIPPSSAKSSR